MPKWGFQKVTFDKLEAELFKWDYHPLPEISYHKKSPGLVTAYLLFPSVGREHCHLGRASDVSSTSNCSN